MRRPINTSIEARERQLAACRAMAPEMRLRLAAERSAEVQTLTEAGTRARAARFPWPRTQRRQVTFGELLDTVIGLLERGGIPYMVTGSLASSYHGEPRATRDADIVIDPSGYGSPWFRREETLSSATAG